METSAKAKQAQRSATRTLSLDQRLARTLRVVRMCRNTLRFHASHRSLMRSARYASRARAAVAQAKRRLARAERASRALRIAIARRDARVRARRLAKAPPRVVICHVFGNRYCRQALAVSWCESRYSTRAQNGQYLGLFQMGHWERSRFGHGPTAYAQARAAHRYFVLTGRDWSPWGCKPWYAT